MIVECGHCGAPLDIEEGREVVTCAYCAKKNRVAVLKTISPTTPTDFKAPEVWKPREDSEALEYHPPAHASAPPPRGRSKLPFVLAGIAAVAAGAIYVAYTRGATVEEVANLPLESTPDQIEKALYVTWRTDDSVRVTFRSGAAGPYEHVNYRWSDKDFTLPEAISLFVAEGSTPGPNVIPTLSKSLHGGLDESGSWRWGAASVGVQRENGAIHLQVKSKIDGQPNPLRKRQLTALWQIVRGAAFGGGPAVAPSELVAVLGGGHPLAKLGAFDPATPFASARAVIPSTFPGSLSSDHTAFEISLDHPLVSSVSLSWDNAAEGRLRGVHFRVAPVFRERLSGFLACVTKEAGPPEKHVSDFAKGTERHTFRVRGSADLGSIVDMHVGDEANLYLVAHGTDFEPAAWRRTWGILDRCR